MQRWTVDAASLVSLALVVAATAALPPAVALSLACCELAFAASAAVRFSAHSSPLDAASKTARATGRKRAASSFSIPILGAFSKRHSDASQQHQRHTGVSTSDFTSGFGDVAANGCSHAEQVADKLFDEREGHLDLLQGGHLLVQWFNGLAGPHQLHVGHVTQLLSYLLLPQPPQVSPAATAAAAATGGGPFPEHDGRSGAERSATAAAGEFPHVPCPRIRTWACRLMELVHRHSEHPQHQQQHPQQQEHSQEQSSAPAAAGAEAAAKAQLLACTADPLVASYRPLVFYLLTEAVAAATHLALLVMGFRAVATPNGTATVYTWTPSSSDATTAASATSTAAASSNGDSSDGDDVAGDGPLVFLHGIGLGLTPYLRLLSRLVTASRGRRPVYAVQYKHVSMRLTTTIPAPHEVAADVAAFLTARGVSRMSLVAHSYGTLIASALTKLAAASPSAPSISRLTLVDPVCFAMFLPHLVRNAIYQQPMAAAAEDQQHQQRESAFSRRRLLRSLIKGLVVAEFHCSVALRRRLDWARVNLWPSELPERTTVVLCGRDNLVPVKEVRRILANRVALLGPSCPHPEVLFREDLGHGGFLADHDCQAHVLAASLGVPLELAKEAIATAPQPAQQPQTAYAAAAAVTSAARHAFIRRLSRSAPQLPQPVASLADSYAFAAAPTIEAVEAVWSQPLGAYFLDSAALAADAEAAVSTGSVSPPLSDILSDCHRDDPDDREQDQIQNLLSRNKAPVAVPVEEVSEAPVWKPPSLQPSAFPLAAAVLVALALAGEEGASANVTSVGGEDDAGGGPCPGGERPSLDDRTRLALLAVLGALFDRGRARARWKRIADGSTALTPLQQLLLQDQARRPRRPRGSGSGGGGSSRPCVVPGAYLPDRTARPLVAPTAPLPAVRAVRRPAAAGTTGPARFLR